MQFLPCSFVEKSILQRVLRVLGQPPLSLMLKGRVEAHPPDVSPVGTLRIQDRRTLLAMAVDPEIGFGEAYSDGRIQIEGDLVQMLEAVYRATGSYQNGSLYGTLVSRWLDFWQANSLRGSRDNIHRHYDLGNDFYRLWLDDQLLYTCAYFPTPETSLEAAQVAKMDYVCHKLRLQPGERVVEAGCGWGAFALHMARNYGVTVKAFNVSREQISFARRKAAEQGLVDRVEFVEDDYRNISGKYDVFVSIGMLEHVGINNYPALGNLIHKVIGDSGRGLLHFIGRNQPASFSRWIRKRIFPGAYPPSLREAISILEPHKFSILDVENLRLHYAKTLQHWLNRFDKASPQIASMYDAPFVRAWHLYLAGSLAGFLTGSLQLFQMTFAGPKRLPLSWTRAPLYTGEPAMELEPQWTHVTS